MPNASSPILFYFCKPAVILLNIIKIIYIMNLYKNEIDRSLNLWTFLCVIPEDFLRYVTGIDRNIRKITVSTWYRYYGTMVRLLIQNK